MSTQLPDRIVRGWQRAFGSRGGDTPRADGSILSVVILDSFVRGGHGGGEAWHVGFSLAAQAALKNNIVIRNRDPIGQLHSLVIVDYFLYRCSVADQAFLSVGGLNPVTFPEGPGQASRSDMGMALDATASPALPNVEVGSFPLAAAAGTQPLPGNDATVKRVDGPWVLAQQIALALSNLTVNIGLEAYFSGRYYPPT